MSQNNIIRRLLDQEVREDLWNRKLGGFPVWPLERLHRYRVDDEHGDPAEGNAASLKRGEKLMLSLRRASYSAQDLARYHEREDPTGDVWVLGASNYRRKDAEGRWRNIFAEHVATQFSGRVLFLEFNYSGLPRIPDDDVVFIDALQLACWGAGYVMHATRGLLTGAGSQATLRAMHPSRPERLWRLAGYGRTMRWLAHRWMSRRAPRALFVIPGYTMFIPFQMAARELGIPVIELQHGIIDESHPGYVFGPGVASAHLPDHIVVFGRHFGELLEAYSPRWQGRWSVGGHPWLKARRQESEGVPECERRDVVFFGQDTPSVRELVRYWVPRVRRCLSSEFRILIKPHPRETDASTFYADLVGDGVELATTTDDTYTLLGRCRVSVTVYSTVAVEALAYRCRSAVIRSPNWYDEIRALVSQGVLTAVDRPEELADLAMACAPEGERSGLAQRLFGIGEPELDFERLIETCREGAAGGRPRVCG